MKFLFSSLLYVLSTQVSLSHDLVIQYTDPRETRGHNANKIWTLELDLELPMNLNAPNSYQGDALNIYLKAAGDQTIKANIKNINYSTRLWSVIAEDHREFVVITFQVPGKQNLYNLLIQTIPDHGKIEIDHIVLFAGDTQAELTKIQKWNKRGFGWNRYRDEGSKPCAKILRFLPD
jgi:hypothetical protein